MLKSLKISNQKLINKTFLPYHSWSTHSKSKNFSSMFDLVQPNSNFYELTQTCQKSHKSGIYYFYEFKGLEIVSLSKTKTEATIRGTIILRMPDLNIIYTGKFISVCRRVDSLKDWKLSDIEMEWE